MSKYLHAKDSDVPIVWSFMLGANGMAMQSFIEHQSKILYPPDGVVVGLEPNTMEYLTSPHPWTPSKREKIKINKLRIPACIVIDLFRPNAFAVLEEIGEVLPDVPICFALPTNRAPHEQEVLDDVPNPLKIFPPPIVAGLLWDFVRPNI